MDHERARLNHTAVNGMQDVAGIGILIAVLDSEKPRASFLIISSRRWPSQMEDAPGDLPSGTASFVSPGDIERQWTERQVNSSSLADESAMAAVRIYTRCFYLNGVSP